MSQGKTMSEDKNIEQPPKESMCLPVGVERLVVLPKLRLRINFDIDLDSLLSMFNRNSTQTIPLSVSCGVEKLSK